MKIWESAREDIERGSLAAVERTIKFRTPENTMESKSSCLAALFYKSDADPTKTYRNVFELIKKHVSQLKDPEETTAVIPPAELDLKKIRRMCEVLYENKGKACIYAREEAQQKRKKKGRDDEGIVIESDATKGMGYADILKKI